MDTLIIKKQKKKNPHIKHLYASEDLYELIKELQKDSGNDLQTITDTLLRFALERVVVESDEGEKG